MATSGTRNPTDGSAIRAEPPGPGACTDETGTDETGTDETGTDEIGIDEIGVVLGPDEPQGGLFERTGTENTHTSTDIVGAETTSGSTSTRRAADRPPGAHPPPRSGPRRRTALLAWIAADLPTPRPTASAPRLDGESTDATQWAARGGSLSAAAAMARVIAEESLDPLPALDGWLSRDPPAELPAPIASAPPPSPAEKVPSEAATPHRPTDDPFPNGLAAMLALVCAAAGILYFLRG